MARRFPAIHVPHTASKEVKAIAEAVTLLIDQRGQGLDRAITLREIGELSGFSFGGGLKLNYSLPIDESFKQSYTSPTLPTGVEFLPTFTTVYIQWDNPDFDYKWYAYTEVWRAEITDILPNPAFIDSVRIMTVTGDFVTDLVTSNTPFRYWLRHVNRAGEVGPLYLTAGNDVTTYQKPADVIAEYSKAIYDSEIYAWLRADINLFNENIGSHKVTYDGAQVTYDSLAETIRLKAEAALAAETSASNSATSADTSKLAAASSASAAGASAGAASTSATAANTSAGVATTKASESSSSASAANSSKLAAASSATAASGSATAADGSKTTAENSATAANTSAGIASTKATEASSSASAASASELTASTKASDAGTSETNANNSADAAASSATAASASSTSAGNSATSATASENSAATSAGTATTKAGEASTSAGAAASSASAANSSSTSAASSASSATTSANTATSKATDSNNSADAASTSASSASTSATNASASASAASGYSLSASNDAGAAAVSAQASVDAGLDYSAQWGVKTVVADLQGGIGFYNDGTTTYFVVDANTFAVTGGGTPGSDDLPFIVKNGVVAIRDAAIDHASIYTLIAANITAETVKASINITTPAISGGSISGTSINISNKFIVDSAGNMTATSGSFGGELDAATGTFAGGLKAGSARILNAFNKLAPFVIHTFAQVTGGNSSTLLTVKLPTLNGPNKSTTNLYDARRCANYKQDVNLEIFGVTRTTKHGSLYYDIYVGYDGAAPTQKKVYTVTVSTSYDFGTVPFFCRYTTKSTAWSTVSIFVKSRSSTAEDYPMTLTAKAIIYNHDESAYGSESFSADDVDETDYIDPPNPPGTYEP